MEFNSFKELQQKQFASMSNGQNVLFITDIDNDVLWETYLESFPSGSNEIYRERREFDCSCCRQFLRAYGNVTTIKDNKLVSIWDFMPDDVVFNPVVAALSELVKSAKVKDVFVSKEAALGTDKNKELLESGDVRTWDHFRIDLPNRFLFNSNKSKSEIAARYRDARNVFKRSLDEISRNALESVLDLTSEKSLYKGDEWQAALSQFLQLHDEYHALPDDEKENYCWIQSTELSGAVSKIRNHSIGVLLQDITKGVDVLEAVRKYEVIVAPTNYKRPKAIFTKKMIEKAQKTITELGLPESLGRRHAKLSDITINNVLWANRDAESHMSGADSVFEILKKETTVNLKGLSNVPSVGIEEFMTNILPTAKNLEVLLENRHEPNLVSLIAPKEESPTLFKWDNSFSWAYSGNIADSMKARVKAAGGKVDGVLRFSLQWSDTEYNANDFDAHCVEPDNNLIYYADKRNSYSTGNLDVDIQNPIRGTSAVENITWSNIDRMQEGEYTFQVHNYLHNGGRSGFDAEIEYDGQIWEFSYGKELNQNEKVLVAKLSFDKENGVKITESLPTTTSNKKVWSLQTNQFHPVTVAMFSPNYWDSQSGIGHKHFMFMLSGCENETRPNGFFNEYLREDFMEHKRVFEALGSKMKVEESSYQLSGLGFSSTKKNSLICKVNDRMVKVVF